VEGALLALGFAMGALVYVAVAAWTWRAARALTAGLLALYWSHRSRAEAVATDRRLASLQKPPTRARERRAA
jgi:hypothetical protein